MARKFDANSQALVAGQFPVKLAVGLLCFGEAGKTPYFFLHVENHSREATVFRGENQEHKNRS
jgi:hypothetical protein